MTVLMFTSINICAIELCIHFVFVYKFIDKNSECFFLNFSISFGT